MLHHLWFMFNTDRCLASNPETLTVECKYVEVGDQKNKRVPKQTTRPSSSLYFDSIPLKGITINYSTKDCLSIQDILNH